MRAFAGVALGTGLLMLAMAAQAEIPIEAPGPAGPLRGSLLTAQVSNAPVVLIIPGSGPTDHDGNNRRELLSSQQYRLHQEP